MTIRSDFRSLLIVAMLATSLLVVSGCRLSSRAEDAHNNAATAISLTDTRLVDQNGKTVSLAALKGKPLIVDFIYLHDARNGAGGNGESVLSSSSARRLLGGMRADQSFPEAKRAA